MAIGPVGGIPHKLRAATDHGADIFLIPQGQRTVVVKDVEIKKKGPFVYKNIQTRKVDLVDLGNKLGVNVTEVNTVEEALTYYTGYSITEHQLSFNVSQYSDIMVKLADRMKSDAMSLLERTKQHAQQDELRSIQDTIDKAEKNYKEGNYYTSTSQYFHWIRLKRMLS